MKILEVNNTDLNGRVFNGYALTKELLKKGYVSNMLVIEKKSDSAYVTQIKVDEVQRERMAYLERKYCVCNVLFPYATQIVDTELFKKADIVHYHFPYHNMISLLDYSLVMDERSVWTIHDMWPLTGNCTNAPKGCDKWQKECCNCGYLDDDYFPMLNDNTHFMWELKKKYISKVNPHIIVSSDYMKRKIKSSPITSHFTDISVIPFGIDIDKYKSEKYKKNYITIGFRADDSKTKGCKFLYDALRMINSSDSVVLECVGTGNIPADICAKYVVKQHGWVNDDKEMIDFYSHCDIFVIPSIMETFCLMAIEAMAAGCTVICFKDTVVEEVCGAPKNAIAVNYEDSYALAQSLELLINSDSMRQKYGNKAQNYAIKYSLDKYVNAHEELFLRIAKCTMENNA